jgi:hypothetical protein
MKCGTASLHRYVGEHPQVCVSSPKETHFFLAQNENDEMWYRNCFETEAEACGEFSTTYTKHPKYLGVPERMHQLLPEVKLIYLVRDPIDRAVSHYVQHWVKRLESDSIDEAFRPVEESWYLHVSRYYHQLTRYLEHYSEEDVLVVQSERLRRSRGDVMDEVFRFIGVDPTQKEEAYAKEYHMTAEKRRKSILAAFLTESKLGRAVKDAGKRLVPRDAVDWAKRVLWTDAQKPSLSEKVRSQARDYLREDVEQLRTFTGKEFREWSV